MQSITMDYFGPQTALHYFKRVADLPYSLLLDSGSNTGKESRFDLLLCQPEWVLTSENGIHKVFHTATGSNHLIKDCFEQLNFWLKTHSERVSKAVTEGDVAHLPFCGGIAGAFAYDLGRQLESIESIAQNDPDIPDLVAGLYWCPLIVDHQLKTATLYDFSPTQNQLHHFYRLFQQSLASGTSSTEKSGFHLTSGWQSNMTDIQYAERYARVKHYIQAGDCYQINLAQRFKAGFKGNVWQAYEHLSRLNQAPFSAFFNFQQGALLSFSPERFIRVEGDRVLTQPIKGTRPRGADPASDQTLKQELMDSEKDKAENLMIVDLLRNDLGRTATPGSVKVTELFGCYSFPSVHHLISTIEATIAPPTTAVDVLKQAFPGGSITGAPKIRAMQIIEELEPHRRHFYCGSIAYFSFHGKMDSSILIRTLMAKNNTLYAWAGGGLVDDSECDLEYQETFAKLSKILQPLSQLQG
jgi:para-aminobenzoate synthetase component 1